MSRKEFMERLAECLASLPENDRRDALQYYEEYFDAAGPEKEAETIAELGSPEEVARTILQGQGSTPPPAAPSHHAGRGIAVAAVAAALVAAVGLGFGLRKADALRGSTAVAGSTTLGKTPQVTSNGTTAPSAPAGAASASVGGASSAAPSDLSGPVMLDPASLNELKIVLDCGDVVFVQDPTATQAQLDFQNFNPEWLRYQATREEYRISYDVPQGESSSGAVLTITLPDVLLDEVDLEIALGSVDLGSLKANTVDAKLALGELKGDQPQIRDLEAELALGDLEINCLRGANDLEAKLAMGSASLMLEGSPTEYEMELTAIGTITVNGQQQTGRYTANQNARREVQMNTSMGDITLDFENQT